MSSDATKGERLARASAAVGFGTLLSRLTGLARVAVLAYAIGRASLADTYNLANATPNIVYELLLGGVLSATLVPLFVEHIERRDERATSALFGTTIALLAVLTVGIVLLAPVIARLYTLSAPGAERAEQREVATFLIRCFLPQIFFYGVTTVVTAMLHARRRFLAAAYAPVLNNVVVIAALLAFARATDGPRSKWVGVASVRDDTGLLLLLGIGTTAGIAAASLALLPALRRAGFRLRATVDFRHEAVRHVVRLSGWTFGYVVANQIALLFVLLLAKSGHAGALSAYQYAFMFFQLPHGLFAVSIMTTVTPELAKRAASRDIDGLRDDFALGLRFLLLVVVPASAALLVLAHPTVAVLVRGGFGADDAAVTADTLQAFALGLVPFSVYLYTLRAFYALQDTRTPFVLNAFENAANIVLAAALFPAFGVQGLALGYGAAYGVAAIAALTTLRRRLVNLDGRTIATTAARAIVAAAALAAIAAPIAGAIGTAGARTAAVAAAAGAAAGGVAYVGALALFGTRELSSIRDLARRRS